MTCVDLSAVGLHKDDIYVKSYWSDVSGLVWLSVFSKGHTLASAAQGHDKADNALIFVRSINFFVLKEEHTLSLVLTFNCNKQPFVPGALRDTVTMKAFSPDFFSFSLSSGEVI